LVFESETQGNTNQNAYQDDIGAARRPKKESVHAPSSKSAYSVEEVF
jgi:hypothetical protein